MSILNQRNMNAVRNTGVLWHLSCREEQIPVQANRVFRHVRWYSAGHVCSLRRTGAQTRTCWSCDPTAACAFARQHTIIDRHVKGVTEVTTVIATQSCERACNVRVTSGGASGAMLCDRCAASVRGSALPPTTVPLRPEALLLDDCGVIADLVSLSLLSLLSLLLSPLSLCSRW